MSCQQPAFRRLGAVAVLLLLLAAQPVDFLQADSMFGGGCHSDCCRTARSGGVAAQTCCEMNCGHPVDFSIARQTVECALPLPALLGFIEPQGARWNLFQNSNGYVRFSDALYLLDRALLI